MPDKRKHRGDAPQDRKIFSESQIEKLSSAVRDFSLLLTKGYSQKSSLKLVGDHFSLTQRQRLAVLRSSCSDQQLKIRKQKQIQLTDIRSNQLIIDGYNLLITIESAISQAVVLCCRDQCCKDLASVHGTYREVTETIPALELTGRFLEDYKIKNVYWLLDKPVSNSGKLKKIILNIAEKNKWNWKVELLNNPDSLLIESDNIIATSDSAVLDKCKRWINLAAVIIQEKLPQTWLIELPK